MQYGLVHANADKLRILESIFWHGSLSRHQIVDCTQFSKTKVVGHVSDLIEAGVLMENGVFESHGGRRAVGISFNPLFGYFVGVNLGISGLEVILSDTNLNLLGIYQHAIDVRQGPSAVMREICLLIHRLLDDHALKPSQLIAIGLGAPGPVDHETGFLISPPIMPGWQGFSVKDFLSVDFEADVYIDNDVNVMALGELWNHRKRNPSSRNENFIVVKLGTGIGAGIIAKGNVFRGADGAAGDVGHICIEQNGVRCPCGNLGCLECYAGAPSIVRSVHEGIQRGLVACPPEEKPTEITLDHVIKLCREGDNFTIEVVQNAGSQIGRMIATLVNFFNPSQVLIGGKVAHISPVMLASIRQSVYARSLALSTRKLRIDYNTLDQQAGTYGAIILAMLNTLQKGVHP